MADGFRISAMNDPTVDWTDGTVTTHTITTPVRAERNVIDITASLVQCYLSPQLPLISSQRAGRGQKMQS